LTQEEGQKDKYIKWVLFLPAFFTRPGKKRKTEKKQNNEVTKKKKKKSTFQRYKASNENYKKKR